MNKLYIQYKEIFKSYNYKPVTGLPLESVTETTDCVTGFPLESKNHKIILKLILHFF